MFQFGQNVFHLPRPVQLSSACPAASASSTRLRAPAKCSSHRLGQLFASFPQLQRRIEVQPALLQQPHDLDQLVAAGFIAKLTNGRHLLGLAPPSSVTIGQPFTHRRHGAVGNPHPQPGARRRVVDRAQHRCAGPASGTVCTTA